MRKLTLGLLAIGFVWTWGASTASAQILIWNLPKEPGGWVRFEGNYKQTRARPNNNAGDEVLEWRSELSISSVGSEQAEFDGASVPCRWVEFKTTTKAGDVDQKAGPGGTYIYKVLIPESKVTGQTSEGDNIPITFLPIIKGVRRYGNREVEPVTEKALAVYPTIAPLTYYPNLKAEGDAVELTIPASPQPISTQLYKGSRVLQGSTNRSINTATLWRTEDLPFGLAKYQVVLTREEKSPDAAEEAFRRTVLIEVEMSAVATGNDARSELPDAQ